MRFKKTDDIKKYESLVDERWDIQSINAVPAFIHAGPVSALLGMKYSIGYGYTKMILQYEKDLCSFYYNRDDMHTIADRFFAEYRNNNRYMWDLREKNQKSLRQLDEYRLEKLPHIKDWTDATFLKEYRDYFELFYSIFDESHIIESIALTTDVVLKNKLLSQLQKQGKVKEFIMLFSTLTQSIEMPFVLAIENSLFRIVEEIKKHPSLLESIKAGSNIDFKQDPAVCKLIDDHIDEYFWEPITWAGGSALTQEQLIEKIRSVLTGKTKISYTDPTKFERMQENQERIIQEYNLSDRIADLIRVTAFTAAWQDERKIYMLRNIHGLQKFIDELAKRKDIDPHELKYLVPEELDLVKGKVTDQTRQLLAQRRKGSVYLYIDKEMIVLCGKTYENFVRKVDEKEKHSETKEINGLCASPGKVYGRVKVCMKPHHLQKLKEGEILVTSMTRPEFVPAMKRAAAVITDEGGLTCHAAIVSRELKIPCVIGTKVATKLLVDGDEVEVDANHGMVRKL